MNRIRLFATAPLVLTLLCVYGLVSAQPAEIVVIDDSGSEVRLLEPAQRIISLAPSLTELAYSAGAGDKLVGVVEYSDFPEQAKTLPQVGRFDRFDIELILSMQPDLILAWQTGNPQATIAQLKQLGLVVYIAEPKLLESIPTQIQKIGQLAGTESAATEAIQRYRDDYTRLSARYRDAAEVRVMLQVWDRPLMTTGGNELGNDLIALCGGRNVFGDLAALAPKVNLEAVLLRDPELIVASGVDDGRPAWLDDWLQWPSISAVANGHLGFIDPDLTQRHSVRVLDGAKLLCEQIDRARARETQRAGER